MDNLRFNILHSTNHLFLQLVMDSVQIDKEQFCWSSYFEICCCFSTIKHSLSYDANPKMRMIQIQKIKDAGDGDGQYWWYCYLVAYARMMWCNQRIRIYFSVLILYEEPLLGCFHTTKLIIILVPSILSSFVYDRMYLSLLTCQTASLFSLITITCYVSFLFLLLLLLIWVVLWNQYLIEFERKCLVGRSYYKLLQ